MYKISVPIGIGSIRKKSFNEDIQRYLDYFRRGNIERVFLVGLNEAYSKECVVDTQPETLKRIIDFFKSNNIETGVWINGFGHGSTLAHEVNTEKKRDYQKQTGVMGESYEHGYCPLDDNFKNDFLEVIRKIAEMNPDIIMIDDDFRMNIRAYYMGCFCPFHIKEFYKLIKETVPREKIEKLVYTGGRNKYRDAYMNMLAKTLIDFAKSVRKTIDLVNPDIRAGACMAFSTWDMEGTDGMEIAKAFAGGTKPFMRTFGAPYHDKYVLIDAIENERLQIGWVKDFDKDIETFSEGDLYPRPRYNVPSKAIELFDLVLICDGRFDGILKYIFDYNQKVGYETGYIEKHIKNLDVQKSVKALFENKQVTGVRVYGEIHKIRDWVLPDACEESIAKKLQTMYKSYTSAILSKNSIPTCYGKSEYPVMVCGESARHIPLDMLKNGALLDIIAAKILSERGIDTGYISSEEKDFSGEFYISEEDTIRGFASCRKHKTMCRNGAEVISVFLPDKTPAVYKYENKDGTRFMVFSCDFHFSPNDSDYFNNYYRQKQVTEGIEWVGRRKLPAVCGKNPNLYLLAAKNEKAMSVLIINAFMDEVENPVIVLDKEYGKIKFVNCSGRLKENKIYLSEIPSYGFAAFEVE